MSNSQLDPQTLEEIKQRVDIVDVISEYVVLNKRGKSLVGLCPFHDENSPSFNVSAGKQLYHCFGCGAGGNAITFLMELKKQSFYEVAIDLARRYQIPLKTLNPQEHQQLQRQLSLKEKLYEIVAVAASFYQHALRQPEGENALNYLKQKRHLKEETIDRFQLGYALSGWETLYRYLVEQKRYPVASVKEAGLLKQRQSGNGYYDVFRDRLMIPIHDSQGRVIAFGSRSLGTKTDEPKYLNSPETPLFDKGKTLFALDKALKSITQQDKAVVVEGYFDAIALHAAGFTNVVASLGTAFSQVQLKQLLRYTDSKQIIFNFDADKAGIKATKRAIAEISSLIYTGQVQLKILNLPDGKDADEFLNSSPDATEKFHHLLKTAPLWFDWQIEQLLSQYNLKAADQFQIVAQNMVKLLSQLENTHQRTYYINSCAAILSQQDGSLVPLQVKKLENLVRKIRSNSAKNSGKSLPINDFINEERNRLELAEACLLQMYLHCPQHRQEIHRTLEEKNLFFSLPHYRFLWQQILQVQEELNDPFVDSSNRLVSLLEAHLVTFPQKIEKIKHLLYSENKTKQEVFKENFDDPYRLSSSLFKFIRVNQDNTSRISEDIKEAFITLELINCTKYKKYCLQNFQQVNSQQEQAFWGQELYTTKQRLDELEELRKQIL